MDSSSIQETFEKLQKTIFRKKKKPKTLILILDWLLLRIVTPQVMVWPQA